MKTDTKRVANNLQTSETFFKADERNPTIKKASDRVNDLYGEAFRAMAQSGPTKVGFKRLSDGAVIPTKAHATDSGFDLVASEDVIIEPGETVVVPTGIAVQLPKGMEAQVRPRSGVTAKTKLRVQLGTIDEGYSGEIGVIVDNIAPIKYDLHSDDPWLVRSLGRNRERMSDVADCVDGEQIELTGRRHNFGTIAIFAGERIAQLVIQRLPAVEAIEVFDVEETERGDRGYGSSGVSV